MLALRCNAPPAIDAKPAQVSHVVNFDMPPDVVTYLHRCGRTARAGGAGMVSNIYLSEDAHRVRAIVEAASAGLPDTVTQRRNAAQKARRLKASTRDSPVRTAG